MERNLRDTGTCRTSERLKGLEEVIQRRRAGDLQGEALEQKIALSLVM